MYDKRTDHKILLCNLKSTYGKNEKGFSYQYLRNLVNLQYIFTLITNLHIVFVIINTS